MPTLIVHLTNRGNPDFGQDPGSRLPGTRSGHKKVSSLEEASLACLEYIRANDLGGGNWTGGAVCDAQGKEVARVSYNGKVWPAGEYVVGQEPLWQPQAATRAPRDPFAFDKAVLDVPDHGQVTVTGSYRVASVSSVPGAFSVRGRRHDFSAYLDLKPEGFSGMHLSELHPDGVLSVSVRPSGAVRQALHAAVRDFLDSPEGKALILGNEVRDHAREVEVAARKVAHAREALAEAEAALAEARQGLGRAEEAAEANEAAGPRP